MLKFKIVMLKVTKSGDSHAHEYKCIIYQFPMTTKQAYIRYHVSQEGQLLIDKELARRIGTPDRKGIKEDHH